jgi:hypothetical protein
MNHPILTTYVLSAGEICQLNSAWRGEVCVPTQETTKAKAVSFSLTAEDRLKFVRQAGEGVRPYTSI